MYTITDEEYLSRPLLDVKFNITEKEVYVSSEHTLYSNIIRLERMVKEDILKLYSEVVKMAKSKGVKLSYKNHYKKKIADNWDKYREEIKYYNELFDKTREKFLEVQKRGIHRGTSEDRVLDEAMNLRNEFDKCYWRTSYISQMTEIYKTLKRYNIALKYPDYSYNMLYL